MLDRSSVPKLELGHITVIHTHFIGKKKSISHRITLDRELGMSLADEPCPRGNGATMDIERHGF